VAKPLAHGIIGLIGAPGAGKSYKAVREIVYSVCAQARPVYTNVPIKPKRLRAYIYRKLPRSVKGHAARRRRSNLVKSITRQHFVNFCERLGAIDELAEVIMDREGVDRDDVSQMAQFRQSECRNKAIQQIEEIEPAKLVGRDANWIPPGSVLFLDELHKWFPSKNYKDEPKAILDFTSMHRHMQLKVVVISQRWMNVSLSFRSMAKEVWYCMNYSKRPILGYIRFDKFINIFRYVHFLGEDIEERTGLPRPGATPVWSEMVWPEWNGGIEYELYSSYSHAGTLEEQEQEIKRITAKMMGEPEPTSKKGGDDMPQKDTLAKKLNRWAMYMGLAGLAFTIGRCTTPTQPVELSEEQLATLRVQPENNEKNTAAVVGEEARQDADDTPPAWRDKRITSMAANWVMIEGRRYDVGQKFGELILVGVDANGGDSAWMLPSGAVYRWPVGGVPRVGSLPKPIADRWAAELQSRRDIAKAAEAATATPDVNDP
jgi:hypothetical protein